MWFSDMFKSLDTIRAECTTAPTPGMSAAAQQSLIQMQNGCTTGRSEEAQVAMQAIATGVAVGLGIGYFVWKHK